MIPTILYRIVSHFVTSLARSQSHTPSSGERCLAIAEGSHTMPFPVACTTNTTECLLQNILAALQESNNAYDWDSITFGFKVAIGVIALLVCAGASIPMDSRHCVQF